MRFHLDEQVSHAVAHGLRLRGIDVTTTKDAGLISAPDETHFDFALVEQRVILTFDQDFLRLAQSGREHAGVVFANAQTDSVGEAVRFLALMHDCLRPEEMKNRIEFL